MWSKTIFFSILVLVIFVNFVIFSFGIYSSKDSLVQASIQLLGSMLPILTLFYVLMHIHYGDDAVSKNLSHLYLKTVPKALSVIEEEQAEFYNPAEERPVAQGAARSTVTISYTPGRIEADYLITLQSNLRKIVIRLEVNVRRINFNIYLDLDQLNSITGRNLSSIDDYADQDSAEVVIRKLGHSVGGAGYAEPKRFTLSQEDRHYQSPYSFNKLMIRRDLNGVKYMCVVAMKTVSADFIWESTERSFFAFDLMLMIRAMINECPNISK